MQIKKWLTLTALVATLNATTGCGIILHPERQGQRGGQLDPAIVILDGIGLFFFLVPGVIAFAVDFTQGTIYHGGSGRGYKKRLSQTDAHLHPALKDMTAIPIEGPITAASIEATLKKATGQSLKITGKNVMVKALPLPGQPLNLFAQASTPNLR